MQRHRFWNARCLAAVVVMAATSTGAQSPSPYAGQQRNEISALSAQEVDSLLAGHGMGFAKAAELNGYPGPLHVVELADQLALTPEQLARTRQLMEEHRARARTLGADVVAAERSLDRLFKEGRPEPSAVAAASARVGAAQAQLRTEHLNTHLAQAALLDASQIRRYAELRGYMAKSGDAGHKARHESQPHH